MPVCVKCEKESNNLRMCPFCHTEYPLQEGAPRQSRTATPRRSTATPFAGTATVPEPGAGKRGPPKKAGLSPVVKLGMPLLIAVCAVVYFFAPGARKIPTGVVLPDIVTTPMSHDQAESLLARIKQTATVENGTNGADVSVTFPTAIWPERRDGQLALAQQYARADGMIEGKKRNIMFYDPTKSLYAKSDAAGVVMVK
jgi:hypothetical protein